MGERIRSPAWDGEKTAREVLEWYGYSAHLLIHPHGVSDMMVPFDRKASHAGQWNGNSIGIEFLVPGVHTLSTFYRAIEQDYVSQKAWAEGVAQVRYLQNAYDIRRMHRHSELDAKKRDPGEGFRWHDFLVECDSPELLV